MRVLILIVIVIADAVIRSAIAQDSVLTETSSGLAEIVRRITSGMPIADAQRKLEGWGLSCRHKLSTGDFGPPQGTLFMYCERLEFGKEAGGLVKRWQVAVDEANGKVSGVSAEYNPIYPK